MASCSLAAAFVRAFAAHFAGIAADKAQLAAAAVQDVIETPYPRAA